MAIGEATVPLVRFKCKQGVAVKTFYRYSKGRDNLSNLDRPEITSGKNLGLRNDVSERKKRNFTLLAAVSVPHAYFQPVLPGGLYSRCWSPTPTPIFP